MMLCYEATDFEGKTALPRGWDEAVFLYCTFMGLDIEGPGLSGVLVGCVIKESCWYWSLFNCATLVRVEFNNCVFRGCAFAGCVFTECRFVDCVFMEDNLGGPCSFTENRWHGCKQVNCVGLVDEVSGGPRR